MKHKGSQRIETERLILRPLTLNDAEDMFNNWANNENVCKFLTWPAYTDVNEVKKTISKWVEEYEDNRRYHWGIELKEIGQVIGTIRGGIIKEEIGDIEVGYCIGEEYWNQGIVTEAFKALIDYFFYEIGANRISANHDVKNPASGKVMRKCGLVHEGTKKKGGYNQQGVCDIAIYALVKE